MKRHPGPGNVRNDPNGLKPGLPIKQKALRLGGRPELVPVAPRTCDVSPIDLIFKVLAAFVAQEHAESGRFWSSGSEDFRCGRQLVGLIKPAGTAAFVGKAERHRGAVRMFQVDPPADQPGSDHEKQRD